MSRSKQNGSSTGVFNQLDRQRSRVNALSSVLAKTDRILTGNRAITVAVKAPKGVPSTAPAWSDGKNISINENMIDDLTKKATLMTVLGLNYHELCHIIYTPRINSGNITYWVIQNGYKIEFNILEDQRIETLFTAIYSPARHYFIQMVLQHIMADKSSWHRAHVLVHGRRYLPLSIRKEFAAKWDDPTTTAEVSDIIDSYRTLDLSGSQNEYVAKSLIVRLHNVLKQLPTPDQLKLGEESECQQQNSEEGEPDQEGSSSASKKAEKDTKEQDEKEKNDEDGSGFWDDSEDEEDDEEGDKGEDGSGNGEDHDDEDTGDNSEAVGDDDDDEDSEGGGGGNGDEDVHDDGDEDSGSGDSDSEGDGGENGEGVGDSQSDGESDDEVEEGGHGEGGGGTMSTEELEDELEDILTAASTSDQTTEDVRQLHEAMNDPNNFDLDAVHAATKLVDIPSHIRNASKLAGDEFRRLYAEMEPGWKYGSDEGRLNVNRAMHSDDDEDIWDEWDEGRQESAGLEVCILLDISVSMSSYGYNGRYSNRGTPIMAACQSVWVLKRACEELGATVSVVGFGLGASTIIPRHEKARLDKAVFVSSLEGDTKPAEAMGIARWVLSQSQMPNKLMVMITDGVWGPTLSGNASRYLGSNAPKAGRIGWEVHSIEQHSTLLSEIPGTKVFLGIGEECQPEYVDKFDVVKTIQNAEEIVPVVKAAITSMMKKVR